jgi:hypothetical protein
MWWSIGFEVDPDGARVVHVRTRDTPQACPSRRVRDVGEGVGVDRAA